MHKTITHFIALLIPCLLFFTGARLYAQSVTTASISGAVLDKDGKPTVSRGKYITVWRKGKDGAWKVVADLGNAVPVKPAN